ncbi:MAG TPA: hypothetical protein VKE70_29960 [Candidatus Solibacter sp.]|nr:hypothetical protein [Candidatus Solibacter sp.]
MICCGGPEKPVASAPKTEKAPDPVKITQFYTTTPQVPRGEPGLVCYGVENAKSVWISPPKKALSATMSRCIEVEPAGKTTYTLTAEGKDGKQVTWEITLDREGPTTSRVHIVNVNISAVEAKAGDAVSICYKVQNAQSVTITPVGYKGGKQPDGCVVDQPQKTTTYTVTATGASGEVDQERVTIKVRSGA